VKALAFCLPHPVLQAHGLMSSLVYLDVGRRLPRRDAGAVPATYVRGAGMTCPHLANAVVHANPVPMFTLTVPASYAGQYVRLCFEPSGAFGRALCRDVPIDGGATIKVPVASDISAKVIKALRPKSKKQISEASSAFLLTAARSKSNSDDRYGSKSARHGR
jgi:hypothetical protein